MQIIVPSGSGPIEHPIRLMARFVDANAWRLHESSETEISIEIPGKWSDYTVTFAWQDGLAALHVRALLDIFIVPQQMDEARKVVNGVNHRMWLGNFDLDDGEGTVEFRHNLPLRGTGGATPEQIEDLLEVIVGECERAYPALFQISTGVVSAGTAVETAMLETVGSA